MTPLLKPVSAGVEVMTVSCTPLARAVSINRRMVMATPLISSRVSVKRAIFSCSGAALWGEKRPRSSPSCLAFLYGV